MTPTDDLIQIAFDAAPVGLVLTEQRVIRACNQTFCALSGYERSSLLEQSVRILYASDEDFVSIRDVGMKTLIDRGNYSDHRLLRRRDGSAVWCRFRAHTLTPDEPLARTVLSYAKLDSGVDRPSLTARERDVVRLLSQGLTSKKIAQELGLSPRSIEDVRARLLKKFNAKNAAEMLTQFINIEM